MRKMIRNATLGLAAGAIALLGGGCSSTQLEKIQQLSTNYQAAVVSINASIAATAPLVAKGCADLQKWAMLIAPFVPTSGKAQQYLGAANGALNGYCQSIPTNVASTVSAVASAVTQAQDGYNQVKAGA